MGNQQACCSNEDTVGQVEVTAEEKAAQAEKEKLERQAGKRDANKLEKEKQREENERAKEQKKIDRANRPVRLVFKDPYFEVTEKDEGYRKFDFVTRPSGLSFGCFEGFSNILVSGVVPGGQADDFGVKQWWYIVSVDGIGINDFKDPKVKEASYNCGSQKFYNPEEFGKFVRFLRAVNERLPIDNERVERIKKDKFQRKIDIEKAKEVVIVRNDYRDVKSNAVPKPTMLGAAKALKAEPEAEPNAGPGAGEKKENGGKELSVVERLEEEEKKKGQKEVEETKTWEKAW